MHFGVHFVSHRWQSEEDLIGCRKNKIVIFLKSSQKCVDVIFILMHERHHLCVLYNSELTWIIAWDLCSVLYLLFWRFWATGICFIVHSVCQKWLVDESTNFNINNPAWGQYEWGGRMRDFRSKLWLSTKIMTFDPNHDFQPNSWFSTIVMIFNQNHDFLSKLWFSIKILIFNPNNDFQPKSWFSTQIMIFNPNRDFQLKSWFSTKIVIFN